MFSSNAKPLRRIKQSTKQNVNRQSLRTWTWTWNGIETGIMKLYEQVWNKTSEKNVYGIKGNATETDNDQSHTRVLLLEKIVSVSNISCMSYLELMFAFP